MNKPSVFFLPSRATRQPRGGAIARTQEGSLVLMEMYSECAAVAAAAGFAPRARLAEFARTGFNDKTNGNVPSMLRDLQRGFRVEAEHLVGDMLARAKALGHPSPLLRAAFTHFQVYQESLAKG